MVDLIYDDIEVHVDVTPRLQDKVLIASHVFSYVEPDSGFDGMSTLKIIPNLQEKVVDIEQNGTRVINHDSEYTGLSRIVANVSVNAERRSRIERFRVHCTDVVPEYEKNLFFSVSDLTTISRVGLTLLHQQAKGNYWFSTKLIEPVEPGVAIIGNRYFYFQEANSYGGYVFICFYSDPYYDKVYFVSDIYHTDDKRFIDFEEPLNYPGVSGVEFLGGFVMKVDATDRDTLYFGLKDYPYEMSSEYDEFITTIRCEYYQQQYSNLYTSFLLRAWNYETFRSRFLELRNSN